MDRVLSLISHYGYLVILLGMLAYFAVLALRSWESRVAVVFEVALLVVLMETIRRSKKEAKLRGRTS